MPEKNNKIKSHSVPVGAIVCAALGLIALAVSVILIVYTDYEPANIVIGALGCYGGAVVLTAVISFVGRRMVAGDFSEVKGSIFGTISLDFIQKLYLPVLICDEKGKIVWYNTALSSKFKTRGVLYGKYIDNICNATIERIIKSDDDGAEVSFISASEIADDDTEVFVAKGYRRRVEKQSILYHHF